MAKNGKTAIDSGHGTGNTETWNDFLDKFEKEAKLVGRFPVTNDMFPRLSEPRPPYEHQG